MWRVIKLVCFIETYEVGQCLFLPGRLNKAHSINQSSVLHFIASPVTDIYCRLTDHLPVKPLLREEGGEHRRKAGKQPAQATAQLTYKQMV